MWSWVKTATTSVAQFGQDCLDSVTQIDEEAEPSGATKKILFGLEGEGKDEKKNPQPPSEECSSEPQNKAGSSPTNAPPPSTHRQAAASSSSWLAPELEFARGQTKNFLAFSRAIVDRGAEVALQLLPDIESSPQQTAQSAESVQPAAQASTSENEDPLDALRVARGAVHLKYDAPRHREIRRYAEEELCIADIVEFDLDDASGKAEGVEYIADSAVGRRIRTARREMSVVISDATGEIVADAELLALLPALAERTAAGASCVVHLAVDELAAVFAVPGALSSKDKELHSWYLDGADGDVPPVDAEAVVRRRAVKVKNLITFAQCEISLGASALSGLAAEALQYAKRTGHPNVKAVKEQWLTARADCYSAAAGDFSLLEEAAECVVALVGVDLYGDEQPKTEQKATPAHTDAPANNGSADPVMSDAPANNGSADPVTGDAPAEPVNEVDDGSVKNRSGGGRRSSRRHGKR